MHLATLNKALAAGDKMRFCTGIAGLYPGDPGPPGSDVSGIISRGFIVEDGVKIAGPGDAVFGFGIGCLGTATITSSATLVCLPLIEMLNYVFLIL